MGRSDMDLFKDKIEVSLDGRQIFFLFFGGAVIASLVFVLGVMVGKRVEARSHVDQSAATSAVLDPLAALDQLGSEEAGEELAFPVALTGGDEAAAMPLGAVDEKLGIAPTAEKGDAPRKPEKRKASEKAKKAKAEKAKKPEVEKAKEPEAEKAKKPEAEKAKKPEAEEKEPERTPRKPKHRYTLQLSSFQDRAEAEAFYHRIIRAGYKAYMVEADVPGKGTWFRVRLGSYDSYNDAIAAKKQFEAKQKIIAYVTRIKR